MSSRVTLSDVAARAGVSRATASLVLRGEGRVSEATRERVNAAMGELGYVYDRVAAAMRADHAPVVGVLVSDITNPFFAQALVGVQAALREEGFLPLLANASHDLAQQGELLGLLREHRVAGLVLAPVAGTPASLVEELRAWPLEHVLLTQPVDGATTWTVAPDDRLGGRLAAEHLLAVHGCRRLLLVGVSPEVASSRLREAGVRDAVAAVNGACVVGALEWQPGDSTGLLVGRAAVAGLGGAPSGPSADVLGGASSSPLLSPLSSATSWPAGPPPDGVVCFSDVHATGLLRAMRVAGRPGALPVTGYDDIPAAALYEPPLTTVSTHGEQLGRTAADGLVRRLRGSLAEGDTAEGGTQELRVPPQLVVRQSCGCP
ncbi:transcriptional regulator, LacI family [Quadrisphaera granulorum]|uniref:LacI family transcriptional regulator n=1 Tax=Quadrisphaera granulorum TaxID=317664 RepID=A0A315ZJY2_9ACTN|nr:LacI family DNA-binding transcriptional regulator [Quadrisphaera granulorum]PWJ45796.1 LacI family transcriptional regulator [Quadrisphaera granulorum]SZE99130.1 transcriptional regulator, LacI family [Quadrisphaera granulorum]